jgi:hypothetical protein
MTGFIDSYARFQAKVSNNLDLDIKEHRHALLAWLNDWGCRNLAEKHHEQAAEEIRSRWRSVRRLLPDPNSRLSDLNHLPLDDIAALFDQLRDVPASFGCKNGRQFSISFGATPTSKTLFALRPHLFAAWDAEIRREQGHDNSGLSYVRYLKQLREDMFRLQEECARFGIDYDALPARLGRNDATIPQLIGEHYWMTITRDVRPPEAETLRDWLSWT